LRFIKIYFKIMNLKTFDWIALILVIVGGLNWALVGLLRFDLVAFIFGDMSMLSRIVYTLVGAAAVYVIMILFKLGRR